MNSISIDAIKDAWEMALIKTPIPWSQFITSNEGFRTLDSNDNIPVVPCMIFTNKKGKSVYKMFGFDSTVNIGEKIKIIDSLHTIIY
jgi:hypothetical protein